MDSDRRDTVRGIFSYLWSVSPAFPTEVLTSDASWFRFITLHTSLSIRVSRFNYSVVNS
jgi:hypothetical protein